MLRLSTLRRLDLGARLSNRDHSLTRWGLPLPNASNSSSLFGSSPFRNLNSLKKYRIATLMTVFDVMRSSVLIFDRCDSRVPIVWMDNSREGKDCALLADHPPRQARFWDYV